MMEPYMVDHAAYQGFGKVELRCGSRRIVIRAALGEIGPNGPYPYVDLRAPDSEPMVRKGQLICSEEEFNRLFDFLANFDLESGDD